MRRTIHLCQRGVKPLRCLACGDLAPVVAERPPGFRPPAICNNRTDWGAIYADHAEYRRCTDPLTEADQPGKRYPTPTVPGFYWAEWRIAEDGSFPEMPEYDDLPPDQGVARVVEVWDADDEGLIVDVAGVAQGQKLENFIWRSERLEVPT